MTTQVYLSPVFNGQQLQTDQGVVLAGGLIYTYYAGTTTPAPTYTTNGGTVQNANPIVLNSAGRSPQEIWLPVGQLTKFIVTDSNGNAITPNNYDNISGINDPTYSSSSSSSGQWTSGPTPTYLTSTTFSVTGNLTSSLTVGRRCQFTVTAGTVYGTISNSVYGSGITTVTVVMDGSQVLDSGLSALNYSILTSTIQALPIRYGTASGTNTYTATVGVATLNQGDEFKIRFTNANTSTTVTLALDGLAATTVVDYAGNAPVIGAIVAGGEYTLRYTTAGTFEIVSNMFINRKPRIQSITSAATITPTSDTADQYEVTALAVAATIAAPTGTPGDGQKLILRISDSGSSQTLSWNAAYYALGITLPTATTAGKTTYVGLVYNLANTRWDAIALATG
jgi:hypothetical protein